jgi:predicted ABC-type ATPase
MSTSDSTQAHEAGLCVRIWYCVLVSAELHIRRVHARVSRD